MSRRSLLPRLALGGLVLLLAAGSSSGGAARPLVQAAVDDYGFQGEGPGRLADTDARVGKRLPTPAQKAAAKKLTAGPSKAVVRWNNFGTPHVISPMRGHLSGPRDGAPIDIAREWVGEHADLFALTPDLITPANLEVMADSPLYESTDLRRMMNRQPVRNTHVAHVVLFRQRFNGVPAVHDGTLHVGVTADGEVTWISSSLTPQADVTNARKLTPTAAIRAAAADVRRPDLGADLKLVEQRDHAGFTTFHVPSVPDLQRARPVAVPTPRDGVRLAWEVDVLQAHPSATSHPIAFISLVDAETGRVLTRHNALQHLDGEDTHAEDAPAVDPPTATPYWRVFRSSPTFVDPAAGTGSADTRDYWCWTPDPNCSIVTGTNGGLRDQGTPHPYDTYPAPAGGAGAPTQTTKGNNAETAPSYVSHLTPDNYVGPVSPLRQYDFPFTDQWFAESCSSTNFFTPARNDIDASTVNLFVMHNRMHDWGYFLGWIESTWNMQRVNYGEDHPDSAQAKANDPETGQAQAGAIPGGIAFLGRDNANQVTLQDGVPGVTNQYLWHPLQAGFYSGCVDGAYDMSIIGHEVTHAISNRMTDGPDNGLNGAQSGAMGESWSDLAAMEYLQGYGFGPVADENPYSTAPYATGSKTVGIRNYAMNASPLDYSNLGYDFQGVASVHSNGEIWSATNFDLRQKLAAKYAAKYPPADKALQYRCADGLLDATDCPGNRRWVQLMFDGFLLQPGATSMLDSRDAQLAADRMRFKGANQKEMWDAFAKRGMGANAESADANDQDATGGWDSPLRTDEARVKFVAAPVDGGGVPATTYVNVGHYEANVSPAVELQGTEPSAEIVFIPGEYEFTVAGEGFGHDRLTTTFFPGEQRTVVLPLRRNHASATSGAEIEGTGERLEELIDDTEATFWQNFGGGDVGGKFVTVALGGGKHLVAEVQVSAAGTANRFTALRAFEILTCDTTSGADCTADESFKVIYASAPDAFPGKRPRPLAPDSAIRTFDVPDTFATHVRMRVVTNQCTGGPDFTGAANPMADPASDPDCVTGFTLAAATGGTTTNTQRENVRAAELQVFSRPSLLSSGAVPPVVVTPPAPVPPKRPGKGNLPATGADLPVALALLAVGAAFALRRRAAHLRETV